MSTSAQNTGMHHLLGDSLALAKACADIRPELGPQGLRKALSDALGRLDLQQASTRVGWYRLYGAAGYPFAWYFLMLATPVVPVKVGAQVHRDLASGFDDLPKA